MSFLDDIGQYMNPMNQIQELENLAGDAKNQIFGGKDDAQGAQGTHGASPVSSPGTNAFGDVARVIDDIQRGDFSAVVKDINLAKTDGISVESLMGSITNGFGAETNKKVQDAMNNGYAQEKPNLGSPTTGTTDTANAAPSTYDQQWASAVDQLGKNFDLLDTASGGGGKDGIIAKCDLEAAMKNPGLPKELKDACKFLLDNPAAFNQLETASGIGNCDGYIGKCDVDAAAKAVKANVPQNPSNPDLTTGRPLTGTVGPLSADKKITANVDGTNGTSATAGAPAPDATNGTNGNGNGTDGGTPPPPTTGSNPFEGMAPEQMVEQMMMGMMNEMDGQLVGTASALKTAYQAAADAPEGSKEAKQAAADINKLTFQMQQITARRSQMFSLLSNMQAVSNEMAKKAIDNLGRI